MIDRGVCLGPGYVRGIGRVVIYASAVQGQLIVLDRKDTWRSLPRDRVIFTKGKHHGTTKEASTPDRHDAENG